MVGCVEIGADPLLLLLLVLRLLLLLLLLLLPPAPKTEPLVVVAVAVAVAAAIVWALLVVWDDNSKLLRTLAVRESERCFFRLANVALKPSKATCCCCCCCSCCCCWCCWCCCNSNTCCCWWSCCCCCCWCCWWWCVLLVSGCWCFLARRWGCVFVWVVRWWCSCCFYCWWWCGQADDTERAKRGTTTTTKKEWNRNKQMLFYFSSLFFLRVKFVNTLDQLGGIGYVGWMLHASIRSLASAMHSVIKVRYVSFKQNNHKKLCST